jgi:AcrR family transcriptional regulator
METWADIDEQTARTFLTAIADQHDPATALPADIAVRTSIVVGGWLLSAFPPEERGWEDFLDEALAAIERAPDPS